MTRTEDAELPVSSREMATMLGMARETLAYYYRTGKIPRPHRCGNSHYYTAGEARQIREWWGMRKRLTFVDEIHD